MEVGREAGWGEPGRGQAEDGVRLQLQHICLYPCPVCTGRLCEAALESKEKKKNSPAALELNMMLVAQHLLFQQFPQEETDNPDRWGWG